MFYKHNMWYILWQLRLGYLIITDATQNESLLMLYDMFLNKHISEYMHAYYNV